MLYKCDDGDEDEDEDNGQAEPVTHRLQFFLPLHRLFAVVILCIWLTSDRSGAVCPIALTLNRILCGIWGWYGEGSFL